MPVTTPLRLCVAAVCASAAAVAAALLPATATAAPPANDNYLASTTVVDADGRTFPRQYQDTVDTTEATVQPDLFDPDREGNPLGGAGPEPTTCGGSSYGKTVWWDFRPPTGGGAELKASGFDAVVAVYEWDPRTSMITGMVDCLDEPGATEDLLLPALRGGRDYTVQVGGRTDARGTPAGGPLRFDFAFFPDSDGDGVLDEEPDKCPDLRGVRRAGGCPPDLDTNPSILYTSTPSGVSITRLFVTGVPKGARVEARCRRCGTREVRRARKRGRVNLSRTVGTMAPSGASIEVLVTLADRDRGRYRFGAIGDYFRWPVEGSDLGGRVTRCLPVGSKKPRRRCT